MNYQVDYHWQRMAKILTIAILFMAVIYWLDNMVLQLFLVLVFLLLGPVLDLYKNERDVLDTVLHKLRRQKTNSSD